MSGFSLISSANYTNLLLSSEYVSKMSFRNMTAYNHMIKKFVEDKVFYQDDHYMIVIDGVLLNKSQLCKNKFWHETIIHMYESKGECFFNDFRGSFSGFLYDKLKDIIVVFSDHIGSKYVYYTHNDEFTIVSSSLPNIYKFFKKNSITYHLNEENAYIFLTYGYMLEDRTLCSEIKKINPGCYLLIEKGKVLEKSYCLLTNKPNYNIKENDAIEIMDHCFRNAIKFEFEKDNEYGYKHLVSLSGGLDSRMTSIVAHEMGYDNQLNITFSQSSYLDETIAKSIAESYKHEWLFKALDNGLWLYDIDTSIMSVGGSVVYSGIAHSNSLLKYLNFQNLGILHSGQLGDVVFGRNWATGKNYVLGDGAYSKRFIEKISNIHLNMNNQNSEIAKLYYRGFNGANNGQVNTMHYTETCSPFMDIDTVKQILTIPVFGKYNNYLYEKWITKMYPNAAVFGWEKLNGHKITERKIIYNRNPVIISAIPDKLIRKIMKSINMGMYLNKKNMNPIAYYIKSNEQLKKYLTDYCLNNLELINNNELRNDVFSLCNSNIGQEVAIGVSFLSNLKLFF